MPNVAPDGKIYVASGAGRDYVHVIEHPDSAGVACEVVQFKYTLENPIGGGWPYFPNFRLGRAIGSPCDTIDFSVQVAEPKVEKNDNSWQLFPNPFDKTLSINHLDANQGEAYTFQLFNVTGLLVFEQKSSEITRNETIQAGFLPAGLYFYAIKNEGGVILQTGKVVKQR